MKDVARRQWLGIGAIALVAALFAFFNSGEAVPVHLGFLVLYRVPLAVLVFIAFVLGMLAMFLAGMRHDMKIRELLRDRGYDVPPAPPTRAVAPGPPASPAPPPASRPSDPYAEDVTRTVAPPGPSFPPYPPPDPEP